MLNVLDPHRDSIPGLSLLSELDLEKTVSSDRSNIPVRYPPRHFSHTVVQSGAECRDLDEVKSTIPFYRDDEKHEF